jgi:hypothetical protein
VEMSAAALEAALDSPRRLTNSTAKKKRRKR